MKPVDIEKLAKTDRGCMNDILLLVRGEKKLKLAEVNVGKKTLGRRHHLVFG